MVLEVYGIQKIIVSAAVSLFMEFKRSSRFLMSVAIILHIFCPKFLSFVNRVGFLIYYQFWRKGMLGIQTI